MARVQGGRAIDPTTLLTTSNGFYFDFATGATAAGIASVTSKAPSTKSAAQATSSKQPNWTAGPPDFALADGLDDNLLSDLVPAASMTLAACIRAASGAAAQVVMGSNNVAGSGRCLIGVNAAGAPAGGWGANGTGVITGGASLTGVDAVILLRANGSVVELWSSLAPGAPVYTGAPSGTTGTVDALAVCALNSNGSILNPYGGRLYRAFAVQSFAPDPLALMRGVGGGICF